MRTGAKKNIGSFLAFTDKWFEDNQKWLLFLLNAPVIKIWARWVLRIRSYDLPRDVKITEIKSNRFSWGDRYIYKKGKYYRERTTDFRTHPKFGKRVYHAFKPVWWVIHFWDWAIADRWIPGLSYGFSTLTAYPDAGTGATTVDGIVSHFAAGSTFATIRAGAGNGSDDGSTPSNTIALESDSTTTMDYMSRSIFLFDTSAIGDTDTVSDAVLSLYGASKTDTMGISPNINIYTSSPASDNDLVNADYAQVGSTAQCDTAISYASWNTAGYNDFTLNSTGRGNVSKTGNSKFGARNANYDAANSAPATPYSGTGISRLRSEFADIAGTSSDPKLVVTYSNVQTIDCNETVTMVDSAAKVPGKSLSEVATIAEVFTTVRVQVKSLDEIITIVETFTRSIGKVYTETVVMVDTITKSIGRSFSEVVTMAETFTKGYVKFLTEDVTISETFTKLLNGSSTIWGYPSKNSASWNFPNRS